MHADNSRWCVVDIPDGESVLVIDGDPQSDQGNSYYLTSAFQPGPRAPTGIRVDTKPVTYLRDTAPELLANYRAIYLLDVDRFEDRAVENLESFVKAGGGLGVFVGERVQMAYYTSRLYRNGEGVFPCRSNELRCCPRIRKTMCQISKSRIIRSSASSLGNAIHLSAW